jgi:hypothetical protein
VEEVVEDAETMEAGMATAVKAEVKEEVTVTPLL